MTQRNSVWVVGAMALVLCGCQYTGGDVWFTKKTQTVEGIEIVLKPEDVPRFKREYTVKLKSRALSMTITASNFLGVSYSGELDQSAFKWVLFDPENPADKILDRDIIGEVEARCKEIIALDKQWRGEKPKEFTDESGQVWVRR